MTSNPSTSQHTAATTSPKVIVTAWADSLMLRGMPEFLSDMAAMSNVGEVDAAGRQELRDFLTEALPVMLKWEGYVRDQRLATVEEIHQEATRDAVKLDTLLQNVGRRRIGGRKFVEERLDDLLKDNRQAPLFWAWRTRGGINQKNRFSPARAMNSVLESPSKGRLANYLGARGMIPAMARTAWPVIGERFRERGVIPTNKDDSNLVGADPTFRILPTTGPSVVLALRNLCWEAAEQAWRRGPQDPETATLALHALCVGMTDSDKGWEQACTTLTQLGVWGTRLLAAGANPDQPYVYRYGSGNPSKPPKSGMLLPKGTGRTRRTSQLPEVRHGDVLGVTAAAMVLAYTPGLVVSAAIEQRRKERTDAHMQTGLGWDQDWLETWAKRWSQHPPRLSFRAQDPDNPTNALFDSWLAGDSGRPYSRNGDYFLATGVLERWGLALMPHDQAPWIDRDAAAWPWGVREALVAVVGVAPEKDLDRTAKPTDLLNDRVIEVLDRWLPTGVSWAAHLLIDMTQSVVGALDGKRMHVREDQWTFLTAVADRVSPEEREAARTYLDSLQDSQNEFLDKLNNDPDIKKTGFNKAGSLTLFKSHKERMTLRACGPLPRLDISRPGKIRTL